MPSSASEAKPLPWHRGTGFAGPLVSSPVGESGEADSGGCLLQAKSLQVPRTLRVAQGTA